MPEPMELAYEERGSGPVLLFVHGFPFDRTMWIAQLAGLAKIRSAVAVDLRGHGLSDVMTGGDFSMDLFADDVAKTLDAIGAEKADIAGLSMGGYVLFSFWRRHPERVRSLIFIDTKAEADSDEAKAGREKTAETAASQGMQPIYETLASKVVGSSPSIEVQDKLKEMMLGTAPEVAAADALAMRDRADSTADLPSITVPVLWLHGEEDALMPVDGARASAAKIPGASFVSIPKGGHVSPMENPEAVNSAIANFLKTE
ncbi:MAG: alpha/beta fold hydrolase [Actinobacteria bacterium]|nr:MAG: alpha/beta fold hydrolase [Actinomycetota bacterium]